MSIRGELLRLALRWLKWRERVDPGIEEVRRRHARMKRFIPPAPPDTRARRIAAGPVRAIEVSTSASRPEYLVLHLHGGAYCYGMPSLYRDLLWRIANVAGARVVSIDYRLAPEHPFPAALDDAVTAYRSLIGAGAVPARSTLIGDSAGGGLALATLLRLRDEAFALPAAAAVLSPWTDLALTGASLERNAKAEPWLNVAQVPVWARYYLAGADPRDPYASPLYGEVRGLPPVLIQVGSDEILRDDSERMAERLRAGGCRVEYEVWPRMPHVWQLFARVVPEGRLAIARIGAFLRGEMDRSGSP